MKTITLQYSNIRGIDRTVSGNFEIDYANGLTVASESNSNGTETTVRYLGTLDGAPIIYERTKFYGVEGNLAEYEYGSIMSDGVDITDSL